MKPTIQLGEAYTPDGQKMILAKHDRDYYISIDYYQLMTSRETESELELARLGCHALQTRQNPHVLIGGLGLGFTLRETLDLLPKKGKVTVSELIPEIVAWNRDLLGELTDDAMQDPRVVVKTQDVCDVITQAPENHYDAILLDVDNGPCAVTNADNNRLYELQGVRQIMRALKPDGCLAIWSVNRYPQFERLLKREKLFFRLFYVRAAKSSKSSTRCIWMIAQDKAQLPPERK